MRSVRVLGLLGLLFGWAAVVDSSAAWAGHRTASWTAPTTNEDGSPLTDLAGYRLYRCAVTPCTRGAGALIGTVAAPTTSFSIPHGSQGFLTVTAVDTSGNESVEDGTAPFDGLAPGPATGLQVQ